MSRKCLCIPIAVKSGVSSSPSLHALLFVLASSVVGVAGDQSVVGAQRPGVRVRAVVELGQDPVDGIGKASLPRKLLGTTSSWDFGLDSA